MNLSDFVIDWQNHCIEWRIAFPLVFWFTMAGIGITINIWKPAK
jgi:hypothetical protein